MNTVRAAQSANAVKTSEPVSEIVPVRDQRVVRADTQDEREIENDLYDNVACTD